MTSVLHSLPTLDPRAGGPPRSVSRLCRELAALDGLAIGLASRANGAFVSPESPAVALFTGVADSPFVLDVFCSSTIVEAS